MGIMLIRIPQTWEIPEREATPESVFWNRRRFLGSLAAGAGAMAACARSTNADGPSGPPPPALEAERNAKYVIDGALTQEKPTATYNNFYEFSTNKDVWRFVDGYQTRPWSVEVSGLVKQPMTYDLDDIMKMQLEERLYRHRCVEAWFMDVPWIGLPLHKLITPTEPLPKARHVRFRSLLRKDEMPGQREYSWYEWPYYEGLTLGEAMNELTLATVGVYGHELPKQNGAPFRVVVPWKYGYKGPKAVVKIELVERQPKTFWNDLQPSEYSFSSNVNPRVPHPRWSQASERSIDGSRGRKTRLYNGYEEWVADLY